MADEKKPPRFRRGLFSSANDNDGSSPSRRRKTQGVRSRAKNIRGLVELNKRIEQARVAAARAAAAAQSRRALARGVGIGLGGVALGYGAYRGVRAIRSRRAAGRGSARRGAGMSG